MINAEYIRNAVKNRPGFTSYQAYIDMTEDAIQDMLTQVGELRILLKQLEFKEECFQENLDREE